MLLYKVIFIIGMFSNGAYAANYFMSPLGNDNNPGTMSLPWKTLDRLQKAQSSIKAGDTIYFRAGSYVVTSANRYYYSWTADGTAAAPVTYKNYNGEVANLVWDWRTAPPSKTYFIFVAGDYTVVEGLQFKQTEQSRLLGRDGNKTVNFDLTKSALFTSGSNIKLSKILVDNFSGVGIQTSKSLNLLVEQSTVRNTGSHCIYIQSKNSIFRNNTLDGGRGSSNSYPLQFQYASSVGNKAYSNLILNAQAAGAIFSGPVSYNEVFNNVFINAGANKTSAGGSVLSFWCETSKPPGPGNRFYNNTAIGKTNWSLINTIVGTNLGTYCRESNNGKPLAALVSIANNIFYPSNHPPGLMASVSSISNNIFYNISGAVPAGNILANPLLVNPLGLTAAAAMLKASSPAIDKGKGSNFPKVDFNGRLRSQGTAFDIGAFEF